MAWEELQVPGEPGLWKCAKHQNTTTRLRCGRCEKPICPRCTKMGPTGARCSDCLSNRSSHIYQVAAPQYALAFGAAAALGALGAAIVPMLGGLWLFALLYAPALGPLLSRVVVRITRGKRGPSLATVTCLGLVVGALGVALALGLWGNLAFWGMLLVATVGTWTTIR
jgi:hypothetical protein